MDPLRGAVVSHYRVIDRIGEGGMGVVYLAEDVRLHRKVALKFITPESAGDAVAQKRLLREAQAASALDHPNIATVHEVGDYGDQLFIAMSYYSGETLKQRLQRGPLPIAEVVSIAGAIAEGLAAAHAADVVHRDLKPANVFLTASGQVKILDFGLAQIEQPGAETASGLTTQGSTVGTVAYMAPEQARGVHVDRRADIWAFGVILFEMLTGRLPFRGDSVTAVLLALAGDPHPPVQSLRSDAPAALCRLVDSALTKDPDRRTLDASEIAKVLASFGASTVPASARRLLARPALAIPAVVVGLGVLVAAGLAARRMLDERWALTQALPELQRRVEHSDFVGAVDLAAQAAPFLEGHEAFAALLPRMTRVVNIESEPPGATVSYSRYGVDADWRALGATPLKGVRVPQGTLRLRAEKSGFQAAEDVLPGNALPQFRLFSASDTPEGMVWAGPVVGPYSIYVFGLETPRVKFDGFWIDKYEVTNRQFKAFVDAGGYERAEYWTEPIRRNGVRLSFNEARALFRDATGRPGPATWAEGTYPAGQDDIPVRGVSWYEAAAYAASVGKALPTTYHWYWAASQSMTTDVVPLGNFGSSAPVAVNQTKAIHRFGTFGLAGNVKEWCVNEAPGDLRYVLGGGFDEPAYMFRDADARSPLERSPNIGFRTVRYQPGDSTVSPLAAVLAPPSRSYANERPVNDEIFQAYRRLYSFDRKDLAPKVDAIDDSHPDWKIEVVSFDAAYGPERMMAYLLLPKRYSGTMQTVVFMPGSPAWDTRVRPNFANAAYGFLLRSGRAVLVPVYKGAWERSNTEYHGGDQLKSTSVWRDYVIYFAKDINRALDYVATRPELDIDKVGFFGLSRGGALSPMMLATEPRFKAAALWINGLYLEQIAPEVDAINFAPRVTIPVLQLNGRYDYNFPPEASSDPFFRLLGTPAEHKRRVLYDTGHNLPTNEAIKETLDWFDKYLGLPQ